MIETSLSRLVAHARTPLYGNGYALVVSTGITSALGLAYWGLAARLYSTDAVGLNAAIISAMMFLAGLAQLNLMSALLRFMPEAGRQTVRLIVVAYAISLVVAGLASVIFSHSIGIWIPRLMAIGSSRLLLLWFSVATIAWCIFVLEDSAITGLRQTIWVPISNSGFSLAKIVLLVLFAGAIPIYGVFASWTIALAASVLLTNALLFARLIPRHPAQARLSEQSLSVGTIARYVAPDYLGSIFWLASTTLLPILVAQEAGLRATAFFYLAWQIGFGLHAVSINMGYSLIVEAATDPQSLAAYSRRVLFLIMRIVVPAAVLLAFGAPYVMRVFGADYAREGSTLLSLLSLSAIPFSVVSLYVSVARVQRRVRQAALVLAFMCCLVLVLSEVFLRQLGLQGVGVAWLLSQVVVGAIVFTWQLWPLWAGVSEADGHLQETVSLVPGWNVSNMNSWPFRSVARRLLEHHHELQFRLEADLVVREILSSITPVDGLPAPATWVIKRIVSVDIARAVVAIGPQAFREPVAVFKLARDGDVAKNMGRQRDTLTALARDTRLVDLLALVPQELASGTLNSRAYVVERALPGVDARLVLSDRDRSQRMQKAAVETVGLLHQRTARTTTVDQTLIKRWIDEPLCLIRRLGDVHTGIAANASAIERLGATLSEGLMGRQLVVSWVHGDFFPGNILVTADGSTVTGLVDWDLAAPDDLPLLDVVELIVGTHLARGRSELGPVVRGLLNGTGFGSSDLQILATTQANLGGDALSIRELVLLSWLRHVGCNLTKSSHFGRHRWWIRENVQGVLESLPR